MTSIHLPVEAEYPVQDIYLVECVCIDVVVPDEDGVSIHDGDDLFLGYHAKSSSKIQLNWKAQRLSVEV